jgi:hypothetical protein
MKWRGLNGYAVASSCGQWRISRSGVGTDERYSVWRREPDSERWALLSIERTAADALAVCAGTQAPRASAAALAEGG